MKAEIVIIGSGVAATALATKLLETDPSISIIIFEAGSKVKMRDFAMFQNYLITNKLPGDTKEIYDAYCDLKFAERDTDIGENVNVGRTTIPLNGSRLFMHGGSTTHWGGWSFRLKPEDFKLRTNTGKGLDWPIDFDELEKYYSDAEHFIGVSGDSEDRVTPRRRDYPYKPFPYTREDGIHIKAFKKLGVTYSHLPIARHSVSDTNTKHAPCQTTGTCKYCPFGARFVAANYLDELVSYPNIIIKNNVIVEEILMVSKSKARGLKCFDKDTNTWFITEAEQIIVASGGIESPKLLQRSESEFWKNGIGNDLDLVGRYFVSHPYFSFKAFLADNKDGLQPQMNFPTLVSRYFDSIQEQAKGKFILVNPPSAPKLQNTSDSGLISNAMKDGKTSQEIKELIKGKIIVQIQGILEVFTEHSNKISNDTKRNRFGLTETVINYTEDKDFNDRLTYIKEVVTKIFGAMDAFGVEVDRQISWRADHAGCTTRMSNSQEEGVVNKNLRIHGVDNIYVCSTSSFSSLGAVNPTLTLTALSLRLADHLIQHRNKLRIFAEEVVNNN